MSRLRVDEDIRPLSEFRAGVATFVKQLHETRRPMVLTQRGRGVAVLLDGHEFVLDSASYLPFNIRTDF